MQRLYIMANDENNNMTNNDNDTIVCNYDNMKKLIKCFVFILICIFFVYICTFLFRKK